MSDAVDHPAHSALAVLDAIGDARCSAGLCGHDADGHDALIVAPEGP